MGMSVWLVDTSLVGGIAEVSHTTNSFTHSFISSECLIMIAGQARNVVVVVIVVGYGNRSSKEIEQKLRKGAVDNIIAGCWLGNHTRHGSGRPFSATATTSTSTHVINAIINRDLMK